MVPSSSLKFLFFNSLWRNMYCRDIVKIMFWLGHQHTTEKRGSGSKLYPILLVWCIVCTVSIALLSSFSTPVSFLHLVLWAEPSLKGSNAGQGLLRPPLLLTILRCTNTVMSAMQEHRHTKYVIRKKTKFELNWKNRWVSFQLQKSHLPFLNILCQESHWIKKGKGAVRERYWCKWEHWQEGTGMLMTTNN